MVKRIIDIELLPIPAAVINRKKDSIEFNDKMKELYSEDKEFRQLKEKIKNIVWELSEDSTCEIIKIKDREFLT